MKLEITTDIAVEPVILEEVKEALKITGTGHDNDLEVMITDARKYIERATDSSVSLRTIVVTSDIEIDECLLPFGPVISSTETTDSDDNYVYTYTAGYDPTPSDMKRLIIMLVKHWFDIDDEATALPQVIKNMIQLQTRNP